MIPKFKCLACGSCCSSIQGLSDEEKKFIEEFGHGKMPLVQVMPTDEMTFPLWDFEAKRFRKYEKDFDVDAKIRLSRGVFDLDSNQFIVFTYHMNSRQCPFLLENGKCKIYKTKRAFICHLFPINKTPFIETGNPKAVFGKCPNTAGIIDKLSDDKEKLIKELHESFGMGFVAAVQHDLITQWSNKLIIDLMKEKKIRPAVGYPYDKLIKRIENSKHIDLMDFLVEIAYFSREAADLKIKSFENLDEARTMIRSYIV